MGYDRYDTRDAPRDQGSRWSGDDRHFNRHDRSQGGDRGRHDERSFWDRASDEVASWFGDDNAERRRRESSRDDRMSNNDRDWRRNERSSQPDRERTDNREQHSAFGRDGSAHDHGDQDRRDRNWNDNRGAFASGGLSERDYDRDWRQEYAGRDFERDRADRQMDRGWNDRYRPITGDYGRGSSDRSRDDERSQSPWARDEYRGTSRAGSANWSDRSREDRSGQDRSGQDRFAQDRSSQNRSAQSGNDRFDPHYNSWRDRHMSELDRDYDDYRAEHQSKFESDFGSWRERRQQKRGLLAMISEHMEVVGNDKKHVGTVDKVAGDRIILTKSDPESGGTHHSLSCSDVDRIEGDKVILDCSADQARERWRDESRSRALFEQDDQGEMGPRSLNRSFEGTYR